MTLKFNSIIFNPLSGVATRRDISWSRLRLSFKDTDADCNPSIELSLLQTAKPGTTIAELESEGRERAKTILRAALDLLEANDITSLLDEEARRNKARRKKYE
jgi:hypothetical protein